MFDTTQVLGPPRAVGEARVAVSRREKITALSGLRQQGSLKVVFPHRAGRSDLQAVTVNTAGGITGGDAFALDVSAGPDTKLTVTTQAAERAYRAQTGSGAGRLTTQLTVGKGATLAWLPQETILFEGSHFSRKMAVDVAQGGRLLFVEPLVFGRAAMGEVLKQASFADQVDIRVDGRLAFADRARLSGDIETALARPGIAAGAGAMASLVYLGPDAPGHLGPLREVLNATSGASLLQEDMLVARFLASDGYALRLMLIPALTRLHGAALPKPWMI